jgi:hypothetical protein
MHVAALDPVFSLGLSQLSQEVYPLRNAGQKIVRGPHRIVAAFGLAFV